MGLGANRTRTVDKVNQEDGCGIGVVMTIECNKNGVELLCGHTSDCASCEKKISLNGRRNLMTMLQHLQ